MKVSIIGGGGLVGSCAGFALQTGRIVRHIHLVDLNQEACEGQALDLLHGASLLSDQKITFGDMKSVSDSDVVVITAGLRRKPEERAWNRSSRVEANACPTPFSDLLRGLFFLCGETLLPSLCSL